MTGAVRRVGAAAARADGLAVAYLLAAVNAGVALAVAFGATVTVQQQAAIIAFTNAVLVAGLHLARRNGKAEAEAMKGGSGA